MADSSALRPDADTLLRKIGGRMEEDFALAHPRFSESLAGADAAKR
jgi:hypothetical protein